MGNMMNRMTVGVAALAFLLTGCAGAQYAMQNYSGITPISWASPTTRKAYRIFDKPAENRLMITLSIGGAAVQGAGAGFTWGLADTRTPEVVYQDAAIEWLATTGRKCTATNASLILEPQYEIRYACEAVVAAPAT
ncbi:hypothetical protein CPJ18_02625 [Agrobacterium rosae]|uniref:Surface antigen domain-containing protein n=2 Tax=Agrobacterium rosae TaxID=1972867 RepID=A0AAE5VRF2_9HYPH|nr:hypothetical protein CPJ18_02625 [Agrobacterium rosae]